jgi:hypothetical protein
MHITSQHGYRHARVRGIKDDLDVRLARPSRKNAVYVSGL